MRGPEEGGCRFWHSRYECEQGCGASLLHWFCWALSWDRTRVASRQRRGQGARFGCSAPLSASCCRFAAIHAEAPEFVEMSVEQEILVTGIKVVDLLAPYAKGGKIGALAPEEQGGCLGTGAPCRPH